MNQQWFVYVGKRILFAIIVLFVLLTIVYFLMDSLPFLPIRQGNRETAEEFRKRLAALGLTQNVWVRYLKYMGGLFRGDFGIYYENTQQKITSLFFKNVTSTLYIAGTAFIVSIILGFVFGVVAAVYRGKALDTLVNVLSVICISVPSFIFAIILLKLGGMAGLPLTFVSPSSHGFTFGKMVLSSILPVTALIFGLASTLTYYVRNELVNVLSQEYIKTAKAKGLSNMQVLWRHGMRNIIIPVLSVMAPSLLYVISGSIVIETFFGVSGVANLLVNGITNRETNLIEFQTLFFSGLYFAIQIILDISYTFIDKRIQLVESGKKMVIFDAVKTKRNRSIWRRRWKLAALNECVWIPAESATYKFVQNKLVDETKKRGQKIHLNKNECETYCELASKKYLVIDREIFKIKHQQESKK